MALPRIAPEPDEQEAQMTMKTARGASSLQAHGERA
jgi:hypothetical protein